MRQYNGNFITATRNAPTSLVSNGVFNLHSQLIDKSGGTWPGGDPADLAGDPTSDWMSFGLRFIGFSGSLNYTGAYDVSQVSMPSGASGSKSIFIGHKQTIPGPNGMYHADCPIAAVQILNSSQNTLLESWVFNEDDDNENSFADSGARGWTNVNNGLTITGTASGGFPESLTTSDGRTFGQTITDTTSPTTSTFTLATTTGSNSTGAQDGIADSYMTTSDGGSGTILPLGEGQVPQASGKYYLYRETSGAAANTATMMKSPAYNFSGGEKIRICHLIPGSSTYQMNPDKSLWIGVA